jgi:AcrR family transcriptional regulator
MAQAREVTGMPVGRGSPINPEATRAKVLATASRLFYERGVHRVGVDEISRSAGASKLSLYRYFRSKEGLVAATLQERSEKIHDWLVRGTADAPPGRGQVLALFDLLLRWYGEEGYHGCAVINTATETRGEMPQVREIAREHLRRYRELLTGRLRDAGAADPEALAGQLLLLIEGATIVSSTEGRNSTAGDDARRAAQTLLDAAVPAVARPEGAQRS